MLEIRVESYKANRCDVRYYSWNETDWWIGTKRRKKGAFTLQVGIGLLTKMVFWIDSNKNYVLTWLFKTELQSLTFIDLTHPDDLDRETVQN
jgi:hypothetical protein